MPQTWRLICLINSVDKNQILVFQPTNANDHSSLETKPLSGFFFSVREDFELTVVWCVLNPLLRPWVLRGEGKTLRSNSLISNTIIYYPDKSNQNNIFLRTKNSDDWKWSLLNFKKQLSNFGGTPIWYNSHMPWQQAYLLWIITGLRQIFSS